MAKKVILAIDDNLTQLDIFQQLLTPHFDVRVVKAASDAMRYLNNNEADLILLDIDMPNISGFEFLSDIRRIPSYLLVPIIIVSGKTGADFFTEARNSTAFDVLSKPVTQEMLEDTIERALASVK